MEMLRDIDEETVDFQPNYDGKNQEPLVLPGAHPEPADQRLGRHRGRHGDQHAAAQPARGRRRPSSGCSTTPTPRPRRPSPRCMERIKGPDFPTHGLIVGRDGIEDAYRTGRGSVRMRAVVTVEEDSRGRVQLVVTELPYQVNPDNLAESIAEAVKDGRLAGHQRDRRRVQRPRRPPAGHHAAPRRRRQGRAEQPLQAHPAADDVRLQHALDRRRRARARCASTSWSGTTSTTRSRSSSGAPATGCARPRSARTSCAATPRRSTSSTRSSPSSAAASRPTPPAPA